MGLANKRAGLFILDRAGYTCCVVRSRPYAKRTKDVPEVKRTNGNLVTAQDPVTKPTKDASEITKANGHRVIVQESDTNDESEVKKTNDHPVIVQESDTNDRNVVKRTSGNLVMLKVSDTNDRNDVKRTNGHQVIVEESDTNDQSKVKRTNGHRVMLKVSDTNDQNKVKRTSDHRVMLKVSDDQSKVKRTNGHRVMLKVSDDQSKVKRTNGNLAMLKVSDDQSKVKRTNGNLAMLKVQDTNDQNEAKKTNGNLVMLKVSDTNDQNEIRRKLETDSFLEMIQIPRGSREKRDPDLLRTALREFCEETLCVNRNIRILEKPVALFWDDGGKRWSYDIYIAFADDLLYFAFEPTRMRKTELVFESAGGWRRCYTAFTTEISRCADGVQFNLIVMHVTDYLDYMKNCQLRFYGENNYSVLFHHLNTYSTDRTLNCFSYDSVQTKDGSNVESDEVSASFNKSQYRAKERRVSIMTKEMYNFITNNTDVYLQKVVKSVYTTYDDNRDMCRRWYRWWRRLTNNDMCRIPIAAV